MYKKILFSDIPFLKVFLLIFISLFIKNIYSIQPIDSTHDIFLRLDSLHGIAGYIEDFWPNINLGANSFEGVSWTSGGYYYTGRSLIKFNLSFFPSNATVINAYLSLYHNPTPDPPGGHAGSNSCYLRRVTSNWDEYTVTWNNQPTTTTVNQILLPQSSYSTQDYLNIDVTTLVSQMVSNPATNFGFFIQLVTEQTYRNLDFASEHCPDSTLRPRLEIIYSVPNGIKPISSKIPNSFKLYQNYPNPFNPSTKIKFDIKASPFPSKGGVKVELNIYDILGRKITSLIPPLGGGQEGLLSPGTYEVEWNADNNPSGVYFYKIVTGDFTMTKRMVLMK